MIVEMLPINDIRPGRYQLRGALEPDGLSGLAESILQRGMLQPVRVRRKDGAFEVVAGHRRLAAAAMAGLTHVPAVVAEVDDAAAIVDGLVENVQRQELSAAERAWALATLRVTLGLQSWEDVARLVGLSRVHVHRLLSVARLPQFIQQDPRIRNLSEKHCRALMRVRSDEGALQELWTRIHEEGLSGERAIQSARDVRKVPRLRTVKGGACAHRPPAQGQEDPLCSLLDETLSALMKASQNELDKARPQMTDLAHWLFELLRTSPPSMKTRTRAPALISTR